MSFQPELEPYKEVIDIMAARIKRAEQHNTYLSEGIFECQKRVERLERENERLNAELEKHACKSSPALTEHIALATLSSPSNDIPSHNP